MLVLVHVHILSIECGGSPSLVLHTREVRLSIRISQSPLSETVFGAFPLSVSPLGSVFDLRLECSFIVEERWF